MSEQEQAAQEAAFRDAEVWVAKEQGWANPIGREVRLAQLLTTRESALRAEIERLKAGQDDPTCMEAEHGGHPTCPHMEEALASLRTERDALKAEVAAERQRANDWMARVSNADHEGSQAVERAERAEAQLAALVQPGKPEAMVKAVHDFAEQLGHPPALSDSPLDFIAKVLAASQEQVKRLEEAVRKVRTRYEEGDPMDSAELERLECEALAAGGEEEGK